jgi:DNA-directed RNA polymerase subunit RPC12/RpoP
MSNTEQPASRKTAPTSYPCPKCGKSMRIAFVEPVDPEHERRRFDCADCKETKTVVVKYR